MIIDVTIARIVSGYFPTFAQLFPKPGNSAAQSFFEADLRLPTENPARLGDIRLAHLRIILGAQIFVHHTGCVAGECVDQFGKRLDRELAGIPDIDRLDLIGEEQAIDPFNQIIDILKRTGL